MEGLRTTIDINGGFTNFLKENGQDEVAFLNFSVKILSYFKSIKSCVEGIVEKIVKTLEAKDVNINNINNIKENNINNIKENNINNKEDSINNMNYIDDEKEKVEKSSEELIEERLQEYKTIREFLEDNCKLSLYEKQTIFDASIKKYSAYIEILIKFLEEWDIVDNEKKRFVSTLNLLNTLLGTYKNSIDNYFDIKCNKNNLLEFNESLEGNVLRKGLLSVRKDDNYNGKTLLNFIRELFNVDDESSPLAWLRDYSVVRTTEDSRLVTYNFRKICVALLEFFTERLPKVIFKFDKAIDEALSGSVDENSENSIDNIKSINMQKLGGYNKIGDFVKNVLWPTLGVERLEQYVKRGTSLVDFFKNTETWPDLVSKLKSFLNVISKHLYSDIGLISYMEKEFNEQNLLVFRDAIKNILKELNKELNKKEDDEFNLYCGMSLRDVIEFEEIKGSVKSDLSDNKYNNPKLCGGVSPVIAWDSVRLCLYDINSVLFKIIKKIDSAAVNVNGENEINNVRK